MDDLNEHRAQADHLLSLREQYPEISTMLQKHSHLLTTKKFRPIENEEQSPGFIISWLTADAPDYRGMKLPSVIYVSGQEKIYIHPPKPIDEINVNPSEEIANVIKVYGKAAASVIAIQEYFASLFLYGNVDSPLRAQVREEIVRKISDNHDHLQRNLGVYYMEKMTQSSVPEFSLTTSASQSGDKLRFILDTDEESFRCEFSIPEPGFFDKLLNRRPEVKYCVFSDSSSPILNYCPSHGCST